MHSEDETVTGVIYALIDRHFYVERTDGTRHIVHPEHWHERLYLFWMRGQWAVTAHGMPAAGLPELMRAEVRLADGQTLGREG